MINKKHYLWALPLAFLLAACGKDEGSTAVYECLSVGGDGSECGL